MSVTVDLLALLDVVSVVLVAAVSLSGFALAKDLRNEIFSLVFGALILGAICSCATPTNADTKTEPLQERVAVETDADRCVGLMALSCARDERCGSPHTMLECLTQLALPCDDVTDLTREETDACAKAIITSTCQDPFPVPCEGIFGPPPLPGVSL